MKEALGRQLFLEKKETEEGKASPAARFILKPFLNRSIFIAGRQSVEAVQEKGRAQNGVGLGLPTVGFHSKSFSNTALVPPSCFRPLLPYLHSCLQREGLEKKLVSSYRQEDGSF